ncbi:MAG: hypothetical protein C5B50_13230 [Verrucomicrobia bacterium]|nr:MAG: hypothetical protein C5B50_13230 [Verrucomicrobiota bacterium]
MNLFHQLCLRLRNFSRPRPHLRNFHLGLRASDSGFRASDFGFRILAQSSIFYLLSSNSILLFASPPEDFPHFLVPGHEQEMATLRDLFWLHYPGSTPQATLWDEWLPDAALWPALDSDGHCEAMRSRWKHALTARVIDPEGYVATHQHASIAHQLGWPFPFWNQGRHGFGWHFSFKNTAIPGFRPNDLASTNGWLISGGRDGGMNEDGWQLEITNSSALITPPAWKCDSFEVPFIQIRWKVGQASRLPPSSGTLNSAAGETPALLCQPFVEWTTPSQTNFNYSRRMYFDAPSSSEFSYTMVPMYRHPQWTGEVAQIRIALGNPSPGNLILRALFSQYDTRHNINNQNFIRGCSKYFRWTGDLDFLRANIQRMRAALRYLMTEQHALERKVIYTTWVGHDGRSGIRRKSSGAKEIITGQGIGNNYWDILPFGNLDCYATIQYYDALRTMAALERDIEQHPEWGIPDALGARWPAVPRPSLPARADRSKLAGKMPALPGGSALSLDPSTLEAHAADVKAEANKLFWNATSGRFVACVDADGQSHDYGFTFLNFEAIYYEFATAVHARSIMAWLNGDRRVEGDTAQGGDIYRWRFAPRATTKRNLDWYFWAWNNPEGIPWGGQVQDGGAVLGFSYHDIMARLRTLGPDNAWHRLQEIIRWFDEVQAAGDYRKYYNGTHEGSLQGAGTPGGLGLDAEFLESALVPQVMLNGFVGFAPLSDGFKLDPHLPSDWPELTIDRIRYHDLLLTIRAAPNQIEIRKTCVTKSPVGEGSRSEPLCIHLPEGEWKAESLSEGNLARMDRGLAARRQDGAFELNWAGVDGVRLIRTAIGKF